MALLVYRNSLVTLVVGILFLNISGIQCYDCYTNNQNGGYTYPQGDIIVEYGKEALEIYCHISVESYIRSAKNPSQYMSFRLTRDKKLDSVVVNATTIKYYDPNPPKSNRNIFCYIDDKHCQTVVVDFNKVFVATPPAMSESDLNFSCISLNNDNLTCSWNKPNNIITTHYKLIFKTEDLPNSTFSCPHIENDIDSNQASCFWSIHTEPPYRQSLKTYVFELYANNSLGSGMFTYVFDHFNNVRPNAPEDLRVVSTTTSSMDLQWKISDTMMSFSKGLNFRVMYLCEYGSKEWNTVPRGFVKDNKTVKYTLSNLKLAHNLCDIRVSLAPNVTNAENMWSNNATITARTASTFPGAPPKVNVGSFETGSDNEALIYWQQVPEEIHNGENFRYNVTLVSRQSNVIIDDIKNTYAVIKNLLPNESYTFAIKSVNNYGPNMSLIGFSESSSYITIPAKKLRPAEPKMLTKKQFNNGTFRIFWHYEDVDHVDNYRINYTVFWCRAMKERPYKCSGYLDWAELPYGTTNFTPQVEPEINNTVYQIAISANSIDSGYTSGMVWECCILAEGNIYKVHLDSAHPQGNSSVKLAWSLQGCIDTTIKEFIISYCPITDPKNSTCKDKRMETTINGTLTEAIIKELKPYTTYLFWVAVRTNSGQKGKESEPIRATILEERPSEPTDLIQTFIGNSSIGLSWKKPELPNGCINKYEIQYNQNSATYITDCTSDLDRHVYTLDHLDSFKKYEISVSACTNFCSQKSNSITVTTLIGFPGRIIQPSAPYINASMITVSWSKPAEARGPINNYQIRIAKQPEGQKMEMHYYNTSGTSYFIKCDETPIVKYSLSVRASNIGNDGEILYGPWSEDFVGSCSNAGQLLFWLLLILLICMLGVSWFILKRFYLKVLGMKNVEMTLPVGLTNEFTIYNKTSNELEMTQTAADEELLLKTRTEITKTPTGESSGCSSTHDSVVSDSGTPASNSSDSGTEQNVLRRRQPAYVPMPTELITKSPPKSLTSYYSKVGLDPALQPETKILPTEPPPFTFETAYTPTVPTITTPTNKIGYVTLDCPSVTTTTANTEPPYVMAGK